MQNTYLCVIISIAFAGIAFALVNYIQVDAVSKGTEEMRKIARAIRIGADTFLLSEYKLLIKVVILLAILLSILISWQAALSFLIGTIMSGLAGMFGMRTSTKANVRVANTARETKDIGATLRVALMGGSVMGLSVSSFALFGAVFVVFLFCDIHHLQSITNWCGISFIPFSMCFTSYSLGCSTIAIFNRIGGGIYTKAADMGADLVGKTEINIPEDDPRNPGVIADCVGDNVGDTAGLGSDLLESYVGAFISATVISIYLFTSYSAKHLNFPIELLSQMYIYPLIFSAAGLVACIIALIYAFSKKNGSNPHVELNNATWLSAGLTAFINLIITYFMFSGKDFGDLPFNIGWISPFVAACLGIISGIIIGMIAEYYTSDEYKPTQMVAKSSKEGTALNIVNGLSVGMESTMLSLIVLGLSLLAAHYCAGIYGVAMAAVGMLSFVSMTVSVDTYGPISDNAGGIAEMAKLSSDVRAITDKLDSVGNTTAAIGKGFAIGSAAFAAVSLMISYLYSFTPIDAEATMDMMNPQILAGVLIGAALPYFFSGKLIKSVGKSAEKMVDEIRRQFREIEGLMEGKVDPDYKKCIGIATEGALQEMKAPAIIAIFVPIASGFIFGPNFVAGILIGSTISAIMLAIFCGNAGGAWDNAKKHIESLGFKGSSEHRAAVVGDTVGDPLKDTVGPSLDILIKIMSTVSIIAVAIFSKYNLLSFISTLLK